MKARAFPCTPQAVASMIRFALAINPDFGRSIVGSQGIPIFSNAQLRLMALGRMKLRPAVLAKINLQKTDGGYLWLPR
ncbi:hypothetical protein DYQ86_16290 [Acidobacteria bacterium AB60]|nr:hypothetical protein DYQ86_16290 [Acidobacteria bacterium AB60]